MGQKVVIYLGSQRETSEQIESQMVRIVHPHPDEPKADDQATLYRYRLV